MKKLSFAVIALTIFFTAFFSGCNEEETTPIGPSLQLFGGIYIDEDVTVEPGQAIRFSWLGTKGDANLASFDIQVNNLHVDGFPVTDLPNDNYKDSVNLEAQTNEGAYEYLFILKDKKDLGDSLSLTITVEKTGGPITTYSVEIGSHQSTSGSSFASTNGMVYGIADAKENATLIDFLYYYGATNLATLAAPDNDAAATVFSGATTGLATWSVRNSTRFISTSLTEADFDAITDDLTIVEKATGAADSDIKQLEQGDVVAFVTDSDKDGGSKMGLVKITSIVTGASGTMQISVKVQQ
jgi:hypothetical protein